MIKWDFKADKPIFLILPGHSVEGLIKRYKGYRNKYDCLWGSMNQSMWLGEWIGVKAIDIMIYYCVHTQCNVYPAEHTLNKAEARGNSLLEFIYQCEENDVKDLVLFGADGVASGGKVGFYWGTSGNSLRHGEDCTHFNANFPKDLKLKIVNVSPESKYHVLNNVTYDEFEKMEYPIKQ